MIFRIFLFAIMAVGLAGFGIVAWVSAHPPSHAAHQAAPTQIAVLVMARDARPGTLLKADDITTKEMPTAKVPAGATDDAPSVRRAFVGAMVRRSLSTGDVILPQDVMLPGDHGFLAAVLQPGMIAVTVGVNAVSGSAGLIWPGDRVDVIMTQLIIDNSLPLGKRVSAQTVLHAARVIAIDQALVQGAVPGNGQSGSQSAKHTVTLEVTPEQAAAVQVATRIGELSLAVCAAQVAHRPIPPDDKTVFADQVSKAMADIPVQKAQGDTLHLFQGGTPEQDFKF